MKEREEISNRGWIRIRKMRWSGIIAEEDKRNMLKIVDRENDKGREETD